MGTAAKRAAQTRAASKSVRTSVTLPSEVYETLAKVAKSKKVTVAWVIRDAAESYLAAQWPLLGKGA